MNQLKPGFGQIGHKLSLNLHIFASAEFVIATSNSIPNTKEEIEIKIATMAISSSCSKAVWAL